MGLTLPSRDAVISKIAALQELRESREQIAAWAISILDDDSVEIMDKLVWRTLKRLGAADVSGDGCIYLYTDDDFAEWKAELTRKQN